MTESLSKTDQCIKLLEILLDPTPQDFQRISSKVNCSLRTVQRAHAKFLKLKCLSKDTRDKLKDIVTDITIYTLQCPKCLSYQEYRPRKFGEINNKVRVACRNKQCNCKFAANKNIYYAPKELIDNTKLLEQINFEIKEEKREKKNNKEKEKKKSTLKKKKSASTNKIEEKESPLFLEIPPDVEFFEFCEKYSYPPYAGLFKFQKELHNTVWDHKYAMIRGPRDHGKSIYLGNLCEAALDGIVDIGDWDILYLGWTDRRKDIAEFVYNYIKIRNQLDSSKGKAPSSYHFRTKKGGRFDTYSITSKDTLGFHSIGEFTREFDEENDISYYIREFTKGRKLLMIIDDPIDITFLNEPHKERNLERKWNSTLANINPDMIIFTGTHKFQGDFLFFIHDKYKDEDFGDYIRRTHLCTPYWWDLFPEIKTKEDVADLHPGEVNDYIELAKLHSCYNPLLLQPDPRFKANVEAYENILCKERWYENESDPNYLAVLDADPKKAKAMRNLEKKRKEVKEYAWHSEYEQNPHPITGDVWKDIYYEPFMKAWTYYDVLVISLDRATTSNAKSSYTGYTVELRERESGTRIVINDFTGMWEFEELLTHVNNFIVEFHETYRNIQIYLVVEKQGGGDDWLGSALGRGFDFVEMCVIIPVHNSRVDGNKKERIKNYLYAPLSNGRVKFLEALRGCETISEILSYPNSIRLDGMDALANAENQIAIAIFIPPHRSEDDNFEALEKNILMNIQRKESRNEFNLLRKDPYHRL